MPPSSALATPTPMNQVPSVAMNEGTLSRTWMTPLTKPTSAPTASTRSDRDEAEIVVVHPVEHGHRQDDGAEREHALDREIDRTHQDDEGLAEAEHERDRRVLAHPHEIAEAEEIAIDGSDDDAQEHEHHRRRPRGDAPAPPWPGTARFAGGARFSGCAQGRDLSASIESRAAARLRLRPG